MYEDNQHNKNHQQYLVGNLEGQVINSRFIISYIIDKGSFGVVYKAIDTFNPGNKLVIKL